MALLGINLDLGGSSNAATAGNLLNLDVGSLLGLHIGAGGTTSVLALDATVGGGILNSTSTSPVINLGLDLGTGTLGGNGGLLGGLLGGGSAGAGEGLRASNRTVCIG